jgi:hypothetical protein
MTQKTDTPRKRVLYQISQYTKPATAAVEQAKTVKPGPPEGNQNAAKDKTIHDNIMNCSDAAQGNSASYTLRLLANWRCTARIST